MRFWDSSALVPLLIQQSASRRIEDLLRRDPDVVLWWATPIECRSALVRVGREGKLAPAGLRQAEDLLGFLRVGAFEIQPVEEVRARAERLLAVHPLRAADSLQLSAALLWCREHPKGVGFVCLDDRLRLASAREGFQVLPYSEEVHEPHFVD